MNSRDYLSKAVKPATNFAKRILKKKEQSQDIDPATAIALMMLLFLVLPWIISSKVVTKKKR